MYSTPNLGLYEILGTQSSGSLKIIKSVVDGLLKLRLEVEAKEAKAAKEFAAERAKFQRFWRS